MKFFAVLALLMAVFALASAADWDSHNDHSGGSGHLGGSLGHGNVGHSGGGGGHLGGSPLSGGHNAGWNSDHGVHGGHH